MASARVSNAHRPYIQPFFDAVSKFVVRCDCGCKMKVEVGTREEAEQVRKDNTLK